MALLALFHAYVHRGIVPVAQRPAAHLSRAHRGEEGAFDPSSLLSAFFNDDSRGLLAVFLPEYDDSMLPAAADLEMGVTRGLESAKQTSTERFISYLSSAALFKGLAIVDDHSEDDEKSVVVPADEGSAQYATKPPIPVHRDDDDHFAAVHGGQLDMGALTKKEAALRVYWTRPLAPVTAVVLSGTESSPRAGQHGATPMADAVGDNAVMGGETRFPGMTRWVMAWCPRPQLVEPDRGASGGLIDAQPLLSLTRCAASHGRKASLAVASLAASRPTWQFGDAFVAVDELLYQTSNSSADMFLRSTAHKFRGCAPAADDPRERESQKSLPFVRSGDFDMDAVSAAVCGMRQAPSQRHAKTAEGAGNLPLDGSELPLDAVRRRRREVVQRRTDWIASDLTLCTIASALADAVERLLERAGDAPWTAVSSGPFAAVDAATTASGQSMRRRVVALLGADFWRWMRRRRSLLAAVGESGAALITPPPRAAAWRTAIFGDHAEANQRRAREHPDWDAFNDGDADELHWRAQLYAASTPEARQRVLEEALGDFVPVAELLEDATNAARFMSASQQGAALVEPNVHLRTHAESLQRQAAAAKTELFDHNDRLVPNRSKRKDQPPARHRSALSSPFASSISDQYRFFVRTAWFRSPLSSQTPASKTTALRLHKRSLGVVPRSTDGRDVHNHSVATMWLLIGSSDRAAVGGRPKGPKEPVSGRLSLPVWLSSASVADQRLVVTSTGIAAPMAVTMRTREVVSKTWRLLLTSGWAGSALEQAPCATTVSPTQRRVGQRSWCRPSVDHKPDGQLVSQRPRVTPVWTLWPPYDATSFSHELPEPTMDAAVLRVQLRSAATALGGARRHGKEPGAAALPLPHPPVQCANTPRATRRQFVVSRSTRIVDVIPAFWRFAIDSAASLTITLDKRSDALLPRAAGASLESAAQYQDEKNNEKQLRTRTENRDEATYDLVLPSPSSGTIGAGTNRSGQWTSKRTTLSLTVSLEDAAWSEDAHVRRRHVALDASLDVAVPVRALWKWWAATAATSKNATTRRQRSSSKKTSDPSLSLEQRTLRGVGASTIVELSNLCFSANGDGVSGYLPIDELRKLWRQGGEVGATVSLDGLRVALADVVPSAYSSYSMDDAAVLRQRLRAATPMQVADMAEFALARRRESQRLHQGDNEEFRSKATSAVDDGGASPRKNAYVLPDRPFRGALPGAGRAVVHAEHAIPLFVRRRADPPSCVVVDRIAFVHPVSLIIPASLRCRHSGGPGRLPARTIGLETLILRAMATYGLIHAGLPRHAESHRHIDPSADGSSGLSDFWFPKSSRDVRPQWSFVKVAVPGEESSGIPPSSASASLQQRPPDVTLNAPALLLYFPASQARPVLRPDEGGDSRVDMLLGYLHSFITAVGVATHAIYDLHGDALSTFHGRRVALSQFAPTLSQSTTGNHTPSATNVDAVLQHAAKQGLRARLHRTFQTKYHQGLRRRRAASKGRLDAAPVTAKPFEDGEGDRRRRAPSSPSLPAAIARGRQTLPAASANIVRGLASRCPRLRAGMRGRTARRSRRGHSARPRQRLEG